VAATKPRAYDVTTIFDTSLTDLQISAFIDDAWDLVSDLLFGTGLSDSRIERIAKYLAAGFAELRDPRASEDRAAGTAVKYQQRSYLDQAIALDTTGKLRAHFAEPGDARTQLRSVTRAGPQETEAVVGEE